MKNSKMRIPHSKLWLAVMMATCVNLDAQAGITTDTSLGHASQTLSGNMTITQGMGSLQGNNLFHSFQAFNINTGESANFTTTSSGIANVISRVTGGSASAINGALTLTPASGAPNFFLINPAGVTFGAGASVNVPGAFHVSTADYVKFADGNYYADLSKASTLSVATPDAFGFLGNSRAAITVNGAAALNNNNQSISLVAGDITLDSGTVSTLSGGDIRVAAVGQTAVDVPFTGTLPPAYGDLNILNGGNISADTATAATAGSVYVSAGAINIDGNGVFDSNYLASTLGISSTNFSTTADGAVGNVNVKATGAISLTNGAVISADTYSAGSAGNVTVTAGSISIDGGGFINAGDIYSSRISSISNAAGDAGAVNVTANGNLSIINDGDITADSNASANAGAVTVNAGSINIDGYSNSYGFTGIASSTWGATGNGGAISITSTGNISLVNSGQIVSYSYGAGDTGSISINAASLSIDGFNAGIATDTFAGGNASSVNITTSGNISLSNSGYLRSTTRSTGNAGNVNITTSGNIAISSGGDLFSNSYDAGNAGNVTINAGSITIDGSGNSAFTGISSVADLGSTGAAGKLDITTSGNIALSNAGNISTSTLGAGDAGTINIHAANISIDGNNTTSSTIFTGIASSAFDGTGNAGNVNITTTGTLTLLGTGQIYTDTFTSGSAGSVTVNAATLLIDGAANGYTSGLLAKAKSASSGQTGNINVTANAITLSNGGEISIQNDATASNPALLTPSTITVTAPRITILNSMNAITAASTGNVDAGNIIINASDTLSLDPSGITTTANLGNGGAISITAGILALNNSEITTSVTGTTGNGGNISITAKTLLLNTGFIQANTAAANASGGTITIAAQNLLPSGNVLFIGGNTPYAFRSDVFGFNVIQAAAPTGISGTPQTTAPTLDLAASMSGLNTQQIDTGGLGRSPCQSTGGSSLAAAGRGGLARGLLRAEQPLPTNKTSYIPQANVLDRQLALTEWSCS
jgi:filamentous hemagglutinin family protein